MAFVIKDRVAETTVTTGTGTVTLLGAMLGFQSFGAIGNANTTCYLILSGNQTDWEMGIGTYTSSGTTLSRTTILSSSNSGSAISLVGSSLVMCAMPSEIASTNGLFDQLFGAVDGNVIKRVSGVWSGAVVSGGGAGGGLWNQLMSATTPTSANSGYSTWVNQGGAAVADNPSGVLLSITSGNANAHALRGRSKAIPTPPFTETFLIGVETLGSLISGAGVGWYDGTKADTIYMQTDGIYHTTWTGVNNATTFTNFNGNINAFNTKQIWLRLKDDNAGNITAQYSTNGEAWVTVFTSTKTAGFLGASGYTNLVWFIDNYNQLTGAVLQSYGHTSP